jgi:alginate O-acetyltransferase complex protein AlgJ
LRPALRTAKRIAPTYYQTDSHWNTFGGFIASEEIIQALAKRDSGFQPLDRDSFELEKRPLDQGDLALMLGGYMPETDLELRPKTNLPPLTETVLKPDSITPTTFTSNSRGEGTCLVFRDSFGPALKPFLGYHFKKTGYYWAPGGFETNTIEEIKPTVVISEIVERHFNASFN